jgi:hypothetical protein
MFRMSASPVILARRHRPHALRVAVALLALWPLGAASVAATEPATRDPDRLLERPLVDVALVDAAPDGRTVDLLTLDTSAEVGGSARLALLRRDQAWSLIDETSFDLPAGSPWLVELGPGRFAVIAPVDLRDEPAFTRRTAVIPVTVDRLAGRDALTLGETLEIDLSATGSGAADVDGDGTTELVVAGETGDLACPTASIAVLSWKASPRLLREAAIRPAGWAGETYLGAAALGEWDGRPGLDLLARAREGCWGPDAPWPSHLLAIRLSDLSTIVDLPPDAVEPPADSTTEPLPVGPPLVVDVDADGRSEAVMTRGSAVLALDPAHDWRPLVVAEGGATLLAAFDGRRDPPSATVAWVGPAGGPADTGLLTARIGRVTGSLAVVGGTQQLLAGPSSGHSPEDLERLIASQFGQGIVERPPIIMVADADADGCLDIVAPSLYAGCEGAGPLWVGPAMVTTRPLIRIGPDDDPSLLTALGLRWSPSGESLYWPPWLNEREIPYAVPDFPSPALAGPPGSWRRWAPSTFLLAESPLADLWGGASTALAAPTIGSLVSDDGTVDLHGPIGSRLLVRFQELCDCHVDSPADFAGDVGAFLSTGPQGFEGAEMLRIPAATGIAASASTGLVRLELTDVLHVPPTGRWVVSVAALDTLGRATAPVRAVVVRDLEAVDAVAVRDTEPPPVSLDAPFLSAPWPFGATVGGRSEAGASVRLGDGPPVAADESGDFRLATQLAPWPQTVEVTAVDASGNSTTTSVSVMGGLDVRQLSWPVVLVVGVFVVGVLGSVRGGGRPGVAAVAPLDGLGPGDGPVIEELESVSLERRE